MLKKLLTSSLRSIKTNAMYMHSKLQTNSQTSRVASCSQRNRTETDRTVQSEICCLSDTFFLHAHATSGYTHISIRFYTFAASFYLLLHSNTNSMCLPYAARLEFLHFCTSHEVDYITLRAATLKRVELKVIYFEAIVVFLPFFSRLLRIQNCLMGE